jgi:uncharacterized Zn-binding protein involved in type VI secretion
MPAIARYLDQEKGSGHCTQPKRYGHVRSVFANGKKLSCQGHINTPSHKIFVPPKKCKAHSKKLIRGSPNVFAEGLRVGRKGDRTGCSKVVKGSPNVYANGG